jgi:hypothetical protein
LERVRQSIFDAGFDLNHEDFGGERKVKSHVIPNDLTLKEITNHNLWALEDIRDWNGHGTMVASIAAGARRGVASNANLVLVKLKQFYFHPIKKGYGCCPNYESSVARSFHMGCGGCIGKTA